jgi:hypothetical protein
LKKYEDDTAGDDDDKQIIQDLAHFLNVIASLSRSLNEEIIFNIVKLITKYITLKDQDLFKIPAVDSITT